MTPERLGRLFLLAALFFLPWQTRLIFGELSLGEGVWEYGRMSVYAVEFLILAAAAFLRPSPLTRPMTLFLGACLVSVAFSLHVFLAVHHLFHVLVAGILFLLLTDSRVPLTRLAAAFAAGLAFPAALGWMQILTGASPAASLLGLAARDAAALGDAVVETAEGTRILRAYGSFPYPNIFGGYLAVAAFALAWLARQARSRRERLVLHLGVVVAAATLVIAFSRSAWLAAAAGLVAGAGLLLWHGKRPASHELSFVALGLAAVFATLVVFHAPISTRFDPYARLESRSIEERAGDYGYFRDVVSMNPFTGVGPGNYTLARAVIRPGFPAYAYQPIHNSALLLFAETGLFGFAVFALFVLRVVRPARSIFAISLLSLLLPLVLLDHYLWSGWAGLALFAFALAFVQRLTKA